ncbi:MAG: DUF1801 domain-containing protein [Hyphomicrobiaceae bacterium]|nr:DUF1801 domain-containing protein [Hyphomicrobiaceae bacterium]
MSKANNKTIQTGQSVADFLASIEHPVRRADGLALLELFDKTTGLPAKMWGSSIIGYGRYHYKYDSGREGEHLMTGFSPRKASLSIYIMPGYRDLSQMLDRLGKHKTGKSCLYINKLADVDLPVLEEIIFNGLAYMRKNYETWDE